MPRPRGSDGPRGASCRRCPAHTAAPSSRRAEPIGPKCDHTVDDRLHPRPVTRGEPLSGMHAVRERHARAGSAARDVLGELRQPLRCADPVPARWTGWWKPAAPSAVLRPLAVAHRALRPAGSGPLDADRRHDRQHDRTPRRRHRAPARAPGHRALGAVRRIVGLDAGACLRRGASGPGPRPDPARRVPRVPRGDPVVHGRHASILPGSVARFRALPAARGARQPSRELPPAAERSRPRGAPARRHCLGPLRKRVLDAAPAARRRAHRRRCCVARNRAHRGALLRPRRVPRTGPDPRGPTPHRAAAVHDRAGALRRRLPPVTALALAGAWPGAECIVVPDAGHSVREPGIARELVDAVRRMRTRVGPKA